MSKTIHHDKPTEAREKFLENLDNACANGKWLAVAFAIGPDGSLQAHRTTYNFPIDRMDEALNLLRQNLDRERGGHRPTPLPLAAHLQQPGNNGHNPDLSLYEDESGLSPEEEHGLYQDMLERDCEDQLELEKRNREDKPIDNETPDFGRTMFDDLEAHE